MLVAPPPPPTPGRCSCLTTPSTTHHPVHPRHTGPCLAKSGSSIGLAQQLAHVCLLWHTARDSRKVGLVIIWIKGGPSRSPHIPGLDLSHATDRRPMYVRQLPASLASTRSCRVHKVAPEAEARVASRIHTMLIPWLLPHGSIWAPQIRSASGRDGDDVVDLDDGSAVMSARPNKHHSQD